MPYEYPPSSRILRHGPIVEGSHYYGKGILFSEQGFGSYDIFSRVRYLECDFEVAYAQTGDVIVEVYPIKEGRTDKRKKELTNLWAYCKRLVGRDLKQGFDIQIEL